MNRVDFAIQQANDAVDRVTTPTDIEQDAAWDKLGWATQKECERRIRKQKRENFFKWLMLCAAVVTIIVLALVYTNQIP